MLKETYKDYLPNMNSWLIPRENGMLLSDYHIEVLARNGINYLEYGSIRELLFEINEILEEDDDEELDSVARDLDEKNYYKNVNK